ncbi:hypothetical protein [Rhodococcus koreensis]
MFRILTLLAAALLLVLGVPATASAAPPVVSPGMKWTPENKPDPGAFCSMSAVGTDQFGNPVAFTAAHCIANVKGKVGDPIFAFDNVAAGPLGTVATLNPDIDYAVIKLAPGVGMKSAGVVTVNSIGKHPVPPGTMLCKGGATSGKTCGPATFPDQMLVDTLVIGGPGDSGAALVQGTALIGHVQGFQYVPPAFTFVRFDVVQQDLAKKGAVGAGFVPAK